MASATGLPYKSIAAVGIAGLTLGASHVDVKGLILKLVTGPGSYSRIAAALIILANIKNLPFVWHVRVLAAFFSHMIFSKHKFDPLTTGPQALFAPVITSSRSPLMECDYNFHKSNSTYFSDLDVTRSHLVCVTLREGIKSMMNNPGQVIAPDGRKAKGKWSIMLGGVAMSFKREVGMYEAYEMWSRVLCWDRKWIYIVSHFVKKGTVKPDGYLIDDGSLASRLFGPKGKKGKGVKKEALEQSLEIVPKIPHKALFASAISKYVMKIGRLTIHPEVVMDLSGLLPPRPGGWNTMKGEKIEANGEAAAAESINGSAATGSEWDWKRVEAENARGMEFAENLAAMDGLHEEFRADTEPALGVYRDLFW